MNCSRNFFRIFICYLGNENAIQASAPDNGSELQSSAAPQTKLYHTLPMSISWSNNLCESTMQFRGSKNGPREPSTFHPSKYKVHHQRVESPASSTSGKQSASNRLMNALLLGKARLKNAADSRSKRSRSVGAMQNPNLRISVATTMTIVPPPPCPVHSQQHSKTSCEIEMVDPRRVRNNGFRTPQASAAHKCKQNIDAGFLSLAQKVKLKTA